MVYFFLLSNPNAVIQLEIISILLHITFSLKQM